MGVYGILNKNNRFTAIMKNKAVSEIIKKARQFRRFRNKKRKFLEKFGYGFQDGKEMYHLNSL